MSTTRRLSSINLFNSFFSLNFSKLSKLITTLNYLLILRTSKLINSWLYTHNLIQFQTYIGFQCLYLLLTSLKILHSSFKCIIIDHRYLRTWFDMIIILWFSLLKISMCQWKQILFTHSLCLQHFYLFMFWLSF